MFTENSPVASPRKNVKTSNIPVTEAAHEDCDIEELRAKKNALKAYLCDMWDKLYNELFEFVTDSDRVQFIAKLQKMEDWLYEDEEVESKDVYVAKLDELKKQGDPIEQLYKDHVIKETQAKKNALQAYALEMKENLLDKLSEFVKDSDRNQLIRKLQETLDWLSEDGEDEINVYVAKLYELKKQGDPIEQRYKEHSGRDSSLTRLRERANWFKKAASGDSKYNHIDMSAKEEVLKACEKAEHWLGFTNYAKDRWAKHDTPIVLLADISKMEKELDTVCIPILFPDVPSADVRLTNETDAANMEDASIMTKNGVVDTGDNSVKMETDTKTMSSKEEEIKKMKLSLKKKKNLRRNRRKKSNHSKENREEEPVSSSSSLPPAMLGVEIEQLINESLKHSYPELLDLIGDFVTVEGDALVMYGDDYLCPNVVHICNKLREEKPDLFRERGTEDIAKPIMENLRKSEMIQQVSLRGGCFVSFKLSWEWMAKRIQKMLDDGIDTWAPIYDLKVAFLEFPTPTVNSHSYADAIRSEYIRDTLARMLEFSGVAVHYRKSYTSINWLSQREIAKKFLVEQGEFKKIVDGQVAPTPLFVLSEESRAKKGQYDSAHLDLESLWSGIHSYQADLIVYITPARQRAYIEKCFDAARDALWLKREIACCCGYWTSSNEKEKLACLLDEFRNYSRTASLVELVKAAGYTCTPEAVFQCALRYTYLKTNRLVDCTFSVEEMLDAKGNTFVHLLNTLALVHTITKTSSQDMFKSNKEFFAKERDLGLHIVRFTDVVEESCSRFLPNLMCEYLCDLCNKFTSCYNEVPPVATRLLLCKATASVIEKCFYLLQITPEPLTEPPPLLDRFLDTQQEDLLNYFIPWPLSNPHRRNNPRLEMVSMHITIFDRDFDEGRMFGEITVSDTCRLQPHGWSVQYAGDNGHISYFDRIWCDPLSMNDSSLLFFGNPSSPQLVALASFMEIKANLMLTCKKKGKGACYTILKTTSPLKLEEFWDDYGLTKCGNKSFRSKDSKVMIFYILMKNAVDISMDLKFMSPDSQDFRVRGHLFAYHRDVLSEVSDANKMFYKAIIFKNDGAYVRSGDQLKLDKSVFAVPADGLFMIEAFLEDVVSGEVIVEETRPFTVIPQGSVQWKMAGRKSKFKGKCILTMNWSTGNGVS